MVNGNAFRAVWLASKVYSASEVTTLWHYTNLFIIIIIFQAHQHKASGRRTRLDTHTHTRLMAVCPGLLRWAGTRKVKPIWILLKQETVSGSGISWAICKSAPRSRQTTTSAPHHSYVLYMLDALPAAQPTASKHWRLDIQNYSMSMDTSATLNTHSL